MYWFLETITSHQRIKEIDAVRQAQGEATEPGAI
jgi:hypothetical protein